MLSVNQGLSLSFFTDFVHSFSPQKKNGAFSFPRETLKPRQTDQRCHHETLLHLDFVDWSNTWSKQGAHEPRVSLKERPAECSHGNPKRRISEIMSDHSPSQVCDFPHRVFFFMQVCFHLILITAAPRATVDSQFVCVIFICFCPCSTCTFFSKRRGRTPFCLGLCRTRSSRLQRCGHLSDTPDFDRVMV